MAQQRIKIMVLVLVILMLIPSALAFTKTFTVQETDLVKISAEAIDPDNDEVIYYYSSPLNKVGEWQTNYGDAGEYLIEITASDGVNQAKNEISIIVEVKNLPPLVNEEKITVNERETVDLKKIVSDPNNDPLNFIFNEPFDKNGLWKTSYNDEGTFITLFKVSDGEFEVKARVEVEVLNTNQPPSVVDSFSKNKVVNVKEAQNLKYFVEVEDDNKDLTYLWKFDGVVINEENNGEYYLDFDSAGEHFLKVFVNDGSKEITKEWVVKVENTNRLPELSLLPINVNEGEMLKLTLPERDLDGDLLSYSFEEQFNKLGEWQTGFEDSGVYEINIYVSDGESLVSEKVEVNVINVDRAPILNVPQKLEVNEGEKLSWIIDTTDSDGDEAVVTFKNAPDGFEYNKTEKEFIWTPNNDYLKRKGGLLSHFLNILRLENKVLKLKTSTMEVTSCSGEKCITKSIVLTVYNVNQAPIFKGIDNSSFTSSFIETNLASLNPKFVDPDGDIIRVTFSDPLSKVKGTWKTKQGDNGKYVVYVAATDGELTTTIPVELEILKNNRAPKLVIKKDQFIVNEGEELSFKVSGKDLDDDELSIRVDNLPEGAFFNEGVFSWKPEPDLVEMIDNSLANWVVSQINYLNRQFNTNKKIIWLDFIVSDGEFDVVHPVKVIIKDVNGVPQILNYLPVENTNVKVGEPLVFHVAAKDDDNNELRYEWDFGFREDKVKGAESSIERTFVSPGKKKVKVTISDGSKKVKQEWFVNVYDDVHNEIYDDVLGAEKSVSSNPVEFKVYVVRW